MLDPEKEKRRWKPAFFCALEIGASNFVRVSVAE
jgi:hypothetical protein